MCVIVFILVLPSFLVWCEIKGFSLMINLAFVHKFIVWRIFLLVQFCMTKMYFISNPLFGQVFFLPAGLLFMALMG